MKRLIPVLILVFLATPTIAIQDCETCDLVERAVGIAKRATSELRESMNNLEGIHIAGLKKFEETVSSFVRVTKNGNCDQDNFNSFEVLIRAMASVTAKRIELNERSTSTIEEQRKNYKWYFETGLDTDALRIHLDTLMRYTQQQNRYILEDTAALHNARLSYANAALSGGCLDIADAEYRAVLKSGGLQFTPQALVGIQDVRDRRRQ